MALRWRSAAVALMVPWFGLAAAAADDCDEERSYTGDLAITSQAELIRLGEKPLWRIDGHLTLSGGDVHELSAFRCLHAVAGDLRVQDTVALPTLAPLGRLETVSGSLMVTGNGGLRDVALGSLEYIGHRLLVEDNAALTSLAEFGNLARVEDIRVAGNPLLEKLPTFPVLDDVRGIAVDDNPRLELVDFRGLETVAGEMTFKHNDSLMAIALPKLRRLNNALLWGNGALGRFEAPELRGVDATFMLIDNDGLEALRLPSLERIGTILDVHDMARLRLLDLPRLVSGNGTTQVLIFDNDNLTRVTTAELAHVNQVRVLGNPELRDFPFGQIVSAVSVTNVLLTFPGTIQVEGNTSLETIDLGKLHRYDDELVIRDNQNLRSLRLAALDSAGDALVVTFNARLSSCDVVAAIARIGLTPLPAPFTIENNDDTGLADLSGLASNADRLASLEGKRCLAGSVAFTGAQGAIEQDDALGDLRFVAGDMVFDSLYVPSSVTLPSLAHVGGLFRFQRGYGTEILELPSLSSSSAFDVSFGPDLAELEAPKLESVGGPLNIYYNGKLERLDLEVLGNVAGNIEISHNPRLAAETADAVISGLDALGGTATVCGNMGGAGC